MNEAQECLGGAGYVEESILPRLYREAPLNSIWEAAGINAWTATMRANPSPAPRSCANWPPWRGATNAPARL